MEMIGNDINFTIKMDSERNSSQLDERIWERISRIDDIGRS